MPDGAQTLIGPRGSAVVGWPTSARCHCPGVGAVARAGGARRSVECTRRRDGVAVVVEPLGGRHHGARRLSSRHRVRSSRRSLALGARPTGLNIHDSQLRSFGREDFFQTFLNSSRTGPDLLVPTRSTLRQRVESTVRIWLAIAAMPRRPRCRDSHRAPIAPRRSHPRNGARRARPQERRPRRRTWHASP